MRSRILRKEVSNLTDVRAVTLNEKVLFRCRLCGRVADLPWTEPPLPPETAGFLLEGCFVVYRGLCPACRKMLDSNAERRL